MTHAWCRAATLIWILGVAGCAADVPRGPNQSRDHRHASGASDGPASSWSPEAAAPVDAPARDAAFAEDLAPSDGATTSDAPTSDTRPGDARASGDARDAKPAIDGGAYPVCPGKSKPYTAYTCRDYCGCWFNRNGRPHCNAWPATASVYKDLDACLAACALFTDGERACRYYRTDNNDFHCPAGVAGNKCP
jgi:hypothetical protein